MPTEKWHARDWKCSISMTTNGLCNVFWPICDFWRKKLIFGTLAHFYAANTVLQLILPISLHFGEKTSAKSGINTAMYDFLFFFFVIDQLDCWITLVLIEYISSYLLRWMLNVKKVLKWLIFLQYALPLHRITRGITFCKWWMSCTSSR